MRKKRRYRRRYRRRMRGMLSGRRRWRRRRRIPRYDEVKTYSVGIQSQALVVNLPSTPTSIQYKQAFLQNSILNSIVQGTNYYERIGNQIYVLNIKFKFNVWMCSADLYELNSGLLRVVLGEPTGTALDTDIVGFYRMVGKDRTVMPLNRKKFTFQYDRTYTIENGYPNRLNATNDPLKYAGAIRHFEFNIPINRRVEYTTDGAVKNQRDQISLFATPYIPNAINAQQVMCSNWSWTIYYVDA